MKGLSLDERAVHMSVTSGQTLQRQWLLEHPPALNGLTREQLSELHLQAALLASFLAKVIL